MSELSDGDAVVPGDFICPASRYSRGEGVDQRGRGLYATLVGRMRVGECPPGGTKRVVRVEGQGAVVVPEVGSVVLCKVESITERQAKVLIVSVNGCLLQKQLRGVVRREDIRETEKDSVVLSDSFRPADILRARVVSLGESQAYCLSTAENELGVVMAVGVRGEVMEPVSWCEVQSGKTGARVKRKVAKVIGAVPE